jgi:hypothetical protein
MDTQEYEAVAQRIAGIYWSRGSEAGIRELEWVNGERKFILEVNGLAGGPYLAFRFYDVETKRLLHQTQLWSARSLIARAK